MMKTRYDENKAILRRKIHSNISAVYTTKKNKNKPHIPMERFGSP